jgi:hypothetical protein
MKKISSILAGLVLGLAPTLVISKVALAECNFHGCSQVPGVECNFHGCPNPPNGAECNFYGCPPATSEAPRRGSSRDDYEEDYEDGYENGRRDSRRRERDRYEDRYDRERENSGRQTESYADCVTKLSQVTKKDSWGHLGAAYSPQEAAEMCKN